MKQSIANFLQFNGKSLLFLHKNSTYYVAIKPVCEALNVDYVQQYKNTNADSIFGPALCKHTIQVPGDQARSMVCLPEYLMYGWIISIKSNSPELKEYRQECYEILFNHFHGAITGRRELLTLKARTEVDRSRLEMELRTSTSFQQWEDLKAQEARIGKQLKTADRTEIIEQMQLFGE